MMNKVLTASILLWMSSVSTPLLADIQDLHYPVPGGIAIVDLDITTKPQQVKFNNRHVMTRNVYGTWHAIVGLSLSTKPGQHHIQFKVANKMGTADFTVYPKEYESQHLTIKNKRKVNPNQQDMQRIGKESRTIRSALATWSEQNDIPLSFSLPVNGRLSSPFGLRRFFNGQARKPHSGLDIAAPEGTPVKSPASGTIINTGDYFFNGNTIFIDHGQGLISMFCHLSKIQVKVGEHVEQGQIVGLVGMTGRVTGPHLHWSLSLNNARIEPRLLLGGEFRKQLSPVAQN